MIPVTFYITNLIFVTILIFIIAFFYIMLAPTPITGESTFTSIKFNQ